MKARDGFVEANEVGVVLVTDVNRVYREVGVALRMPHRANCWHGVGALVGCITVENGKE